MRKETIEILILDKRDEKEKGVFSVQSNLLEQAKIVFAETESGPILLKLGSFGAKQAE